MHNQGVIHSDIKLENILMNSSEFDDEYPTPKICDFGLCHVLDPQIGKAHMKVRCGTQGYIAPEQVDVSIINS